MNTPRLPDSSGINETTIAKFKEGTVTRNKVAVPSGFEKYLFLRQLRDYSSLLKFKTLKSLKFKMIKFKNLIAKILDIRHELKNDKSIISKAIRGALRLTIGVLKQVLEPRKEKALKATKVKKNRSSRLRFNSPTSKVKTAKNNPIKFTETPSIESLCNNDNLLEQAQSLAEAAKDTLMKNLEKYDDESKAELLINLAALSENWDSFKSLPLTSRSQCLPYSTGTEGYSRPALEALSRRPKIITFLTT